MLRDRYLRTAETFGVIPHDFSSIQSQYDMSQGQIDHWCLKGDNDSCRCEDPLVPSPHAEYKTWVTAHHANKQLLMDLQYGNNKQVDVAFLGESPVEAMDGRWMGKVHTDQLKQMEKSFKKYFNKEKSGIEGVALGVAGDTAPNVLWRLMHGEMPDDFDPTVWWVVLGMNDLGRMQCSEEVVVMGILRVVEEILARRPNTRVVINSMLPMADLRGGIYPLVKDYRDAFRPVKGKHAAAMNNKIPASHFARAPPTTAAAKKTDQDGAGAGSTTKSGPAGKTNKDDHETAPKTKKEREEKKKDGGGGDKNRFLLRSLKEKKQKKKKLGAEEHSSDEEEPNNPDVKNKKNKRARKKPPKEPYHPKLDAGKTKIKKYDPKSAFLHQNRLPLWTSIAAINRQLQKFCNNHERVSCFDATDIFAERLEGRNKYVLLNERISVRGHPTVEGFDMWEAAILERVKKLVEKARAEQQQQAAAAAAAMSPATFDEDPFYEGDDWNYDEVPEGMDEEEDEEEDETSESADD